MNNEWIICLSCGTLAGAGLLRMMRRRQLALIGLLKEYVDRQTQWNRRRSKAEAIAAKNEVQKTVKTE
jgi:hypothetical protein